MDGFIPSAQRFIEAFLAFEYADQTLIALGAVLLLIGVVKILKNSLAVLFWFALSALGASSIAYGMNRSGFDWPSLHERGGEWADRLGDTAGTSAEALVRAWRELRGG